MLTDGIDVAINAMTQQTQNSYNDYKNYANSDKKNNLTFNDITERYATSLFKQVDVNLDFVLSLVQERIYTAFYIDANTLTDKFQNEINIFNSVAIIYCVLLGFFVMIYVITKVKIMTKTVEVSTMRLNKAFCFIKENNLGNQIQSQSGSFCV